MRGEPHQLAELTRPESLRLLDQVPIGRIVYTVRALPAIVPANHLVDDGMVVVSTHVGTECAGSVVAYQADQIDVHTRTGWSVTVTGIARPVLDPDELGGYSARLTPLIDARGAVTVRVYPEIVTGHRMIAGP